MAPTDARVEALDFDANRTVRSTRSNRSLLDDDVDLIDELAQSIVERDRRRVQRQVLRSLSFVCAVLNCLCAGSIATFSLYGGALLTDLHYSQFRVNAVSLTAELAMYLPVPLFGYLCDRFSPRPLSLLASLLFGAGYVLAAFVYRSGPPRDVGGAGLPFGVMVVAFVGIGAATSCMYLAAVATCAKNYALSPHRGFMLAVPIAAFGISGLWQSQVGAQLLPAGPDKDSGSIDVFRYFLFLAGTLAASGIIGSVGLRIVDEEILIEHGIEDLERSGLLVDSEFFQPQSREPSYGTIASANAGGHIIANDDAIDSSSHHNELTLTESQFLKKQEEEEVLRRKKTWLLNHAAHAFLTDRSMWLLAAGFFLLTGPGEAYINNLGTIILSLTTPTALSDAGRASTHVSLIALTSTIARLGTGYLSDTFAPPSASEAAGSRRRPSFSRMLLLLPSATVQLLAFLILALPFLTPSHPRLFLLSSSLLGLGYGACFSLVPIIISVVWGAENFATNWGIIAMMPAGGAVIWSVVYSLGYSRAASGGGGTNECIGASCFSAWAYGCAASVAVAIALLASAWRTWTRRHVVV
ncbi:hypothetical protein DV735_g174, partial [Chaetothyriales sp. CBS 134920]